MTTAMLDALLPYTGDLALVLRVWVGANFIIHARPKLGAGTAQTVQWVQSMGVPAGAAYAATALELFGGMLLIVGLIVPIVALLFAAEMVGAAMMKKVKMHAAYIATGKPSYEIDALYLALSLTLMVLGAGALSLDGLLGI